jgi:hypothetical protein
MPSYYEALPICSAAMDVAVRVVGVALEEPEPCGHVKRSRLAYVFERPVVRESEQEKAK